MTRHPGDTTEKFLIQKFYWKDVYARLEADKSGERTFRYRVVPLEGDAGHLVPMKIPFVTSNEVTITSKIVVIDPFSDKCVVITGSHNLGHKASYNNDENLVIVRGNQKLARAYATHVLDVYDHFAWRATLADRGERASGTLSTDPDSWQSWYFRDDGSIKVAQLRFWLNAKT